MRLKLTPPFLFLDKGISFLPKPVGRPSMSRTVLTSWACAMGSAMLLVCSEAVAQPADPGLPPPAAAATTPQSRLTGRLLYELLLSEILFGQSDPAAGAAYMLKAARRTGEESLFRRATEMAIQSRSGPAALESARAWRQAHPESIEAGRYELQVLIALGRALETEAPLRTLLSALPVSEHESFLAAIPALYQRVADKTGTAQTVERALATALKNPATAAAAWTAVGRLRMQAGDTAGALSAATLGQSADIDSEWPTLLALQLLVGEKEPKADALIQRYMNNPQAKPELQIGYARALIDLGRTADAHAQLALLRQRLPEYPDGWLVHGALYADEGNDAQAEPMLRRYLELSRDLPDRPDADSRPKRSQAYLVLARIAERRGDYADAETLLARVDSPDQMHAAQSRRASLLARQGRLNEAVQLIRAVEELRPEDARLKLLTEAQLLRDHGQPVQAFQLLSAELVKDPDDESLLYDAAMAAEKANRLEDMERLFRQLITLKPDSAHAYNALGYSLADRGLRLQEAKSLIEKAVQLAPEDSYIQDSLGWVHFRLGRVEEARRILEAAYRKRPDVEIAAHLGEVLWTLHQREAARRIWREGMNLDASNETLRKTLQRLRVTP